MLICSTWNVDGRVILSEVEPRSGTERSDGGISPSLPPRGSQCGNPHRPVGLATGYASSLRMTGSQAYVSRETWRGERYVPRGTRREFIKPSPSASPPPPPKGEAFPRLSLRESSREAGERVCATARACVPRETRRVRDKEKPCILVQCRGFDVKMRRFAVFQAVF